MKFCSKCHIEKELSEFHKNGKWGYYSICKDCKRPIKIKIKERLFQEQKKCCSGCKSIKLFCEFSKNHCQKDGLSNQCKICYQKYYKNNYFKRRKQYRLKKNLRTRIWETLKRNSKSKHTLDLLGCSVEFLKQHLESKFTEGMSWSNYGKWHIDHIKPCAKFDLSDPKQQEECFNYKNLQPLWALDNIKKGDILYV